MILCTQFWRVVKKQKRKSPTSTNTTAHQVEDMLEHLSRFDRSLTVAQKEYVWLLNKYPTSITLLSSYAVSSMLFSCLDICQFDVLLLSVYAVRAALLGRTAKEQFFWKLVLQ